MGADDIGERRKTGPLTAEHGASSLIARRPRLTLAAVVILAIAAPAAFRAVHQPARKLERTPTVQAALSDPGSPRAGSSAPTVTVVVFTDYQCAVCKTTDPALGRLIADDPRVQVIYKDWPVFGEPSRLAARAALAADRQEGYLRLHAGLMAQPSPLTAGRVKRAALDAGLDWERLSRDLLVHGAGIDRQLARHRAQAWALGLRGTPSYLVGPYLIEGGLDDRRLRQAVRRARRG